MVVGFGVMAAAWLIASMKNRVRNEVAGLKKFIFVVCLMNGFRMDMYIYELLSNALWGE